MNSRTLSTVFNHPFGCPKLNLGHSTHKEAAFNHFAVSYFINKSLESPKTFRLGTKAQTSTSGGFKPRRCEYGLKVLASNVYSNFDKQLQIQ